MVTLPTLRTHWPAVLLALLAGLVLVMPALVAKVRFGIDFGSPANIRINDESLYFARIRDVIDGYPTIGNPYLFEHKAKPPSPIFLGEFLVALPIIAVQHLAGLTQPSVVAFGAFYDFLLPALLTLLTYACLFAVTRRRWVSVCAAAYLFLGLPSNDFGRVVSPQFNFLFWLSLFLLLYLVFAGEGSARRRNVLSALAAVNFGLLFYLYTYYWTFYLAFLGIFAVWHFIRREHAEGKRALAIAGGGLVVAIPYLLLMLRAWRLPEYAETLRRIGMIDSHFPSGIAIVAMSGLLLAAAAFLIRRGVVALDGKTIFLASGVAAALASVNQHVITGKNLEFSSHYFLLSVFWCMFAAAYLLAAVWANEARFRAALAVVVVAVVAFTIALKAPDTVTSWFAPPSAEALARERALPVLEWLNTHAAKNDVVYAPGTLSALIPIYTAENVYFAGPAHLSFMSDAEVLDRFVLTNYFRAARDFSVEFARENLQAVFGVYSLDTVGHLAQENRLRAFLGLAPKPIPPLADAEVERILQRARELRSGNFEKELRHYRVDYAVWDRVAEPSAPFGKLSFLKPAAALSDFTIYRVR